MDEYSTQSDSSVFREEKDSETVDVQNVASSSDDTIVGASSSNDTIVGEFDENRAFFQVKAVKVAAKSIENMTNRTKNVKPGNLETEAALSNTKEATSSRTGKRTPRTECQLAAHNAEKMSEEASRISRDGRALLEMITLLIEGLQSHVRAFATKASEATEVNTDRGYNLAGFYRTMIDKYETSIGILDGKSRKLDLALDRVEDAAHECLGFALFAEETLDESERIKSRAKHLVNKGKSAIIAATKRERAALLEMRLIYLSVLNDVEHEATRTSEDDSDYNTPECTNKDRMTKMGHAVSTVLGISLLSVTSLFEVGSDSHKAILALGLLTTGWCTIYWSHKFYKCLKSKDAVEESMIERRELRDTFLENLDTNLERVRKNIHKYDVSVHDDAESDTGCLEAIRVDTIDK